MGLALGGFAAAWLGIALSTPPRQYLWGDEGTYTAMTASLVRDGDLDFTTPDLEWVETRQPDKPVTVILQKDSETVAYSKPILYPLLAAPLFRVIGEQGLVATNLLLLLTALILTAIYLRPLDGSIAASWTLLAGVGGSVLSVYVGWAMSDVALFSLTLAGLVLSLGGRSLATATGSTTLPFSHIGAAIVGGLLLGGAISMRLTSAALVAGVLAALVLDRRARRALVVATSVVLAFLAVTAVTRSAVGSANPYKAIRSSFNEETGYPVGERQEEAARRFVEGRATQSATWTPPWQPRMTLYSSLYFLIGRHTGLLPYFPVALLLLAHLFRRLDRVAAALLLGALAVVGFYLIWMPENYFGGSTFVGNRYFLGVLPVLFAGLSRLPGRRSLAPVWGLAALAWISAFYSVNYFGDLDRSSQAHTHAGIFRWLPFESTARRIDGIEERFWADDYVRFLDPFARVSQWSFRLDSTQPATEVLIATAWPGEKLQFVVASRQAPVTLEVSDRGARDRFTLPQTQPAPSGLVSFETSPPWRRHQFWWHPDRLYDVRVLRFRLQAGGDQPASAVVRYAGKGRELAPLAAELLQLAPGPATVARAGATTPLTVRVRNVGRRPWRTGGMFPVRLAYRLPEVASASGRAEERSPLPRNVRPGEEVEATVEVRWPAEPGRYHLLLDLVREPAGRLGDLGRLNFHQEEIEVKDVVNRDSPRP